MSSKKIPHFSQSVSDQKNPRSKHQPDTDRSPRIDFNPKNNDSENIAWRVHLLDFEGEYSWLQISADDLQKTVLQRMRQFETMTWAQIKQGTGSHSIPISDLCKEAQKRLEELKQTDAEELFSLRLSNKERIWGIRDGFIFKILWWDPKHQICPSPKKHT